MCGGGRQSAGGRRRVGRSVRLHPRSRRRLLRVSVLPGTTQQTSQAISTHNRRSRRRSSNGVSIRHRQTQSVTTHARQQVY